MGKLEILCNTMIENRRRDGDLVIGVNARKLAANSPCTMIENADGTKVTK